MVGNLLEQPVVFAKKKKKPSTMENMLIRIKNES